MNINRIRIPIAHDVCLLKRKSFRGLGARGARRLQEVSSRAEETGKTSSRASDSAVGSAGECGLGSDGAGTNW